ncbi:MAG TPA: AAA family ATPase [Bryobacteraceae bacterium]|nr:AAA family ATPase [Bryobacteraceae bacterium]
MKIKSYFAASVEHAIQQAREQLGAEAMLITSRRASPEARHFGAYEVVFGIPSQHENSAPKPEARDLSSEMQALRAQLDEIKRTLQLSNVPTAGSAAPEVEELIRDLTAGDISDTLAQHMAGEAYAALQSAPAAARSLPGSQLLRELAVDSMRRKLQFAPSFQNEGQDPRRMVIFAGPPGAGKTTTLAKIAIRECLAQRLSLRIISVDPQRVAAHEKLRTLAGILGAGFTAASTIQQFIQAVDEFQNKNILLVDTPGYSRGDLESSHDLAGVLSRMDRKETHLVLPASMKRTDLTRSIHQFEQFSADYLLFTKLDETESLGGIVSAAIETNKPLSFFATGQSIPEDLEPASCEMLLNSVLTCEQARAISAA